MRQLVPRLLAGRSAGRTPAPCAACYCLHCSCAAWVCIGCLCLHAVTCTLVQHLLWDTVGELCSLAAYLQLRAGTRPELVWPWERSDPARSWDQHHVWDRLLCNSGLALPLPATTSSQGFQLCSYCTDGEGFLPFNTP